LQEAAALLGLADRFALACHGNSLPDLPDRVLQSDSRGLKCACKSALTICVHHLSLIQEAQQVGGLTCHGPDNWAHPRCDRIELRNKTVGVATSRHQASKSEPPFGGSGVCERKAPALIFSGWGVGVLLAQRVERTSAIP
jgi:hypothetical protein